jgi:hypothetical protein
MNNKLTLISWLALGLASACRYDEGLSIYNLSGTVTIPRAAATRTLIDPSTGTEREVTDVRLLGPVYVGLYPSLDRTREQFPLPEEVASGEASPYSGTTIGDIRYGCFEFFRCKMMSGRYLSYDDIIDFYTNVLGTPPKDDFENIIEVGQYIQQTCFDLLEVTSDDEIRVLAKDRNDDGTVDKQDLDFVEDENGDFVGKFEILQADFYPGMVAWGFLDDAEIFRTTRESDGAIVQNMDEFTTCDPTRGYSEGTYQRNYRAGLQATDTLNRPLNYLKNTEGWVSDQGFTWTDPAEPANIVLDVSVVDGKLEMGE